MIAWNNLYAVSGSLAQAFAGSKPPPFARGVNPRVPLGLASHLGPVRH